MRSASASEAEESALGLSRTLSASRGRVRFLPDAVEPDAFAPSAPVTVSGPAATSWTVVFGPVAAWRDAALASWTDAALAGWPVAFGPVAAGGGGGAPRPPPS